jgi:hypothetical protein
VVGGGGWWWVVVGGGGWWWWWWWWWWWCVCVCVCFQGQRIAHGDGTEQRTAWATDKSRARDDTPGGGPAPRRRRGKRPPNFERTANNALPVGLRRFRHSSSSTNLRLRPPSRSVASTLAGDLSQAFRPPRRTQRTLHECVCVCGVWYVTEGFVYNATEYAHPLPAVCNCVFQLSLLLH